MSAINYTAQDALSDLTPITETAKLLKDAMEKRHTELQDALIKGLAGQAGECLVANMRAWATSLDVVHEDFALTSSAMIVLDQAVPSPAHLAKDCESRVDKVSFDMP